VFASKGSDKEKQLSLFLLSSTLIIWSAFSITLLLITLYFNEYSSSLLTTSLLFE
jgi:hypothetical protein